jgi:heptosyltransferase-1
MPRRPSPTCCGPLPGTQVDWLVEKPFAAIPALHPGVRRVLPLAWRKWRKKLFDRATWRAMGALARRSAAGTL